MHVRARAQARHRRRTRMVADALEEEIVLGWLLPRERLIEEDIAARLDVKRHVVREALAELERVGLVERVPNKGAAVRLLEPQEVRQIYSVREALETLAAEQIPLPAGSEIVSRRKRIQGRHAAAVVRPMHARPSAPTWRFTRRSLPLAAMPIWSS